MSAACYIILNKHWFLQVSWILNNEKDAAQKMNYLNITSMPVRVKLFGFLRDKYAYIAVSTFVPLFIAFYNGGFLNDYDPDDLPSGALSAANTFGTLFVLVFFNFQAGIIFTIIIVLLMYIATNYSFTQLYVYTYSCSYVCVTTNTCICCVHYMMILHQYTGNRTSSLLAERKWVKLIISQHAVLLVGTLIYCKDHDISTG